MKAILSPVALDATRAGAKALTLAIEARMATKVNILWSLDRSRVKPLALFEANLFGGDFGPKRHFRPRFR